MSSTRCPRGFSLIELLAVILVMSILATVVLTSSEPSYHEQLQSAARMVAAELNYARSLAETNGSRYKAVFSPTENRITIRHSGDDAALDRLPQAVFQGKHDTPEEHIVDLDEMDCVGTVSIYRVAVLKNSLMATNEVEFSPLGETTAQYPILIWLSAGPEDARYYLLLAIDPVTGLSRIGKSIGLSALPLIAEHDALRDVTGAAPSLPSESE